SDAWPQQAVGALAIDPTDDDVLVVGTGEANYANHSRYGLGVFRTEDGGATWSHHAEATFAGRTFSKLAIDPSSPSILYAAVARAGGFPALAAAKGHPGANGPVGVFKSTDGGASWTHLTSAPAVPASDVAVDPANPNVVYAAIGDIFGHPQNGVWKSTDGGLAWTKLGGGLPSQTFGRVSVALAPSNPLRLYALVTNAASSTGGGASSLGAWRSDDGGASWASIPVGSIQASYGWYLSIVTVSPTNPDAVLMGGLTLRRSTNAGANWSTVTPPHVDLHAAAWDASGRLVVGDDGGVHRSTNLGSSWSSLNQGLGLTQLYAGLSSHPTDDETFLGGFQDNGSNRRSTATTGWTQVFGGDGGWTQIDPVNPNVVFVEYQGSGNLFRSTDGGNGFSSTSGLPSSDRHCFLPPYLIDPQNPGVVLYGTHRIHRSTNGGVSFAPVTGDLTTGTGAIRCLAQAPSDPTHVYAATNDGLVLRSTDSGFTWTTLLTGQPGWPRTTRELTVHPTAAKTVFLAGAAFGVPHVRKSTDAGQTWTTLDGDLPDVPVNVVAVVDTDVEQLFAGTDAGLYHSANGGETWRRYGEGLPNATIVDLLVDRGNSRIVVATQGRGVWRAPLVPKPAESG
ncbi:MAG: WD40/YVTN/BNR-like repeat-containing protein, partial [Planctomycetota bacterium JB042]